MPEFCKQLKGILSGYKNVNTVAGNNTIRVVLTANMSKQETFDVYDELITEAELQIELLYALLAIVAEWHGWRARRKLRN